MAKYLVQASYSAEGLQGLAKEGGAARKAAITKAVKALGGKVEAMYFAFGDQDAVLIVDAPDAASVAAINLAAGATGLVRTKTTALLTPDEIDQALKKKVNYRPPGA